MLILVGPSASGKTQIVLQLINKYNMQKLVTYTSREKRIGEVDGKDYHFISKDKFLEKIDNNFFIEYVNYNNNYYGTSRSDLDNCKVVILEPTGLKHYLKEKTKEFVVVFLETSKEVLKKRMEMRGDKLSDIEKRLRNDDEVFNDDVKKLADLVLNTTNSTIDEDSSIIYNYYQRRLKENEK